MNPFEPALPDPLPALPELLPPDDDVAAAHPVALVMLVALTSIGGGGLGYNALGDICRLSLVTPFRLTL